MFRDDREKRYRARFESCLKAHENDLNRMSKAYGVRWQDFDFTVDLHTRTKNDEFMLVEFLLDEWVHNEIYNSFDDKISEQDRLFFIDLCIAQKTLSELLSGGVGPNRAMLLGMAYSRTAHKVGLRGKPELTEGQKMAGKNRHQKVLSRIAEVFEKMIRHEFKNTPDLENGDLLRKITDPKQFEKIQLKIFKSVPLKVNPEKTKDAGKLIFTAFDSEKEYPRDDKTIRNQISDIKGELYGSQKSRKR